MQLIKIPLTPQQLSVVSTANLMLDVPYNLEIEGVYPNYHITIANDDMGLDLIHNIEDILAVLGFDKDYVPNPLGDVCEDLIDLFGKFEFS